MAVRKRGFSLIEISIAIAALALISSGVIGMFGQGFSYLKKSKERSIAYNLAQEKLEEKLSLSPWPPTSEIKATVAGFPGFYRQVITTSPYAGYSDLAQIRVTVWWNNDKEQQSFDTLKANY